MRERIPSEHEESVALAQYLEILLNQGKIAEFSHTAQETYTKSWYQKRKNVAEGVRSGVPDYIIVTHTDVLFIEMKRIKGGQLSEHQKRWIEAISNAGCKAFVCKGFLEAKEVIDGEI